MLFKNVNRSVFDLDIHLGEVFADDAEAEKNETADKKQERYNRCVAGHVDAEEKLLDNNHQQINYRAE